MTAGSCLPARAAPLWAALGKRPWDQGTRIGVGQILDDAECFDCSQRPSLGLCCWPVPLRARQSIREARGEVFTPLFEPSAEQGGTLPLALRGCKHPNWVCAPVSSVETRASFQQAATNAAAPLGMPMPSGEARSTRARAGGMRVGLGGAWSLVNVVEEGENLITSGKMQWGYTKYTWCGAQKSTHFCTKDPKKQQLHGIG